MKKKVTWLQGGGVGAHFPRSTSVERINKLKIKAMLTAIFCKNSADGLIGMASLKWLYRLSWTLPVEEETNMQKH